MTDEHDETLTTAAVAALRSALTCVRAHATGTDLGEAIDRLTECKLLISAAGAQVTIELFAPAKGGDTVRFFAITAEERLLQ